MEVYTPFILRVFLEDYAVLTIYSQHCKYEEPTPAGWLVLIPQTLTHATVAKDAGALSDTVQY